MVPGTAPLVGSEALPLRQPRGKVRLAGWLVLLAVVVAIWWMTTNDNPVAQELGRVFHRSHVEAIAPANFDVASGGFSSFRFAVPSAARDVTVDGHFSVQDGGAKDIEVQLLTQDAFVSWQDGYSTRSYYTSGRVNAGEVNAALPSSDGTYYLVFSNKFSPKAPKGVQCTVTLRYQRWWPIY